MCSDGKTEFENFKCTANNFKFGGEKKKEDETPTMEQETSSQDLWKKELGREKERERVV